MGRKMKSYYRATLRFAPGSPGPTGLRMVSALEIAHFQLADRIRKSKVRNSGELCAAEGGSEDTREGTEAEGGALTGLKIILAGKASPGTPIASGGEIPEGMATEMAELAESGGGFVWQNAGGELLMPQNCPEFFSRGKASPGTPFASGEEIPDGMAIEMAELPECGWRHVL